MIGQRTCTLLSGSDAGTQGAGALARSYCLSAEDSKNFVGVLMILPIWRDLSWYFRWSKTEKMTAGKAPKVLYCCQSFEDFVASNKTIHIFYLSM